MTSYKGNRGIDAKVPKYHEGEWVTVLKWYTQHAMSDLAKVIVGYSRVYRYDAVIFSKTVPTFNRHPIARPWGQIQGM